MPAMTRFVRYTLAAAALAAFALPVYSQTEYPNKPVRLIVGFAAGGISDVLARAITVPLSRQLGQQVIVENRPGAGTTIAGDATAKAAPDGYTIWLQDITAHAINATLVPKLPYDTVRDFTPIALVASTPLMLVVHPSNPARNVIDLRDQLRAKPGYFMYGSSGSGASVHMASEMFRSMAGGLDVIHVPYRGSAPATTAILSNEVTFVFSTMPPAVSNVQAGKLRALAVTTAKRVAAAPDVPTMAEAGVPGYELVLWSGVLGPANLPQTIVRRLNTEFARALQADEVKGVYSRIGAEPISTTPEAFRDMIDREVKKLAPVVRASGAKPE
jgi:tripartite-type tricarboxylate transporter receptor subunit TctC